jgi:hypothetical protein
VPDLSQPFAILAAIGVGTAFIALMRDYIADLKKQRDEARADTKAALEQGIRATSATERVADLLAMRNQERTS